MDLRLYNTLTKEKQPLRPLDPSRVRMYVCGPTVYDFAHIGNARPVIVFDVLFRLLRHVYGADHVAYVRNITDVDDKINARAARDFPDLPLNAAIRKVTEETEAQFHADVDALGCLRPSVEPRATEHIPEMRAIVEKLIKRRHAYVERDHVLFAVASMKTYGRLARRSLDEMLAGARIDVAPYKRDAMDFVLWKPSKPGEPSWPSPAGIAVEGRPGWHLECSAMAWKHLGEQFDIHGGGIDLVFPHHENELAQSCCAFHHDRMANVWMHNGFLQVEGEKMSKSLGNFVTIRELREGWAGYAWPGDALRFAMLGTHYRQPIDWTAKSLDEAHKTLWRWYGDLDGVAPAPVMPDEVLAMLADDLNTSGAIAVLHALHKGGRLAELRAALSFLGFGCEQRRLQRRPAAVATVEIEMTDAPIKVIVQPLSEADVAQRIAERAAARAARNFAESDRIRDELAAMGIVLKDGKDADGKPVTTWEVAR
ncbi:MAG: cysteine--tRNA ligase [Xanthobacteraceae bacterium]|nr:cysteine--tRNA ligase [Xanthobacteraceae bacterium]